MKVTFNSVIDERIRFMSQEVQFADASCQCARAVPSPSLRVPVTPANRAYLCWLRAAELIAWESGRRLNARAIASRQGNSNVNKSNNQNR